MKRYIVFLVIIALLSLFAGCESEKTTSSSPSQNPAAESLVSESNDQSEDVFSGAVSSEDSYISAPNPEISFGSKICFEVPIYKEYQHHLTDFVKAISIEMPFPEQNDYPIEKVLRSNYFYYHGFLCTEQINNDNLINAFNSAHWGSASVYPIEKYTVLESANGYKIYKFLHGMSQKYIDIYSEENNQIFLDQKEFMYLILYQDAVIYISFRTDLIPGIDVEKDIEDEIYNYLIENIKISDA